MSDVVTVTLNPSIDVSAIADEVVPVHKLRCDDVRRDPGGGGINVARVLQRLGGGCRAIYPAGGILGRLLRRLLEEEGVESLALDIAEETRESFTVLERSSGEQYRFVLPGPQLARAEWQQCIDCLAALPEAPAYVVASGSLPPGVPEDFYAQLAAAARARGSRMVLDTSGPALAAALEEGVYLVKPNLRELRQVTGEALEREEDWARAAGALVGARKAEVVALSLGHRGALLAAQGVRLRAPALEVKIASTVGAGDSFLAAMVWRLAAGGTLAEAFRHGMAGGAAALLSPGTGLARKDDVERLSRHVQLEPV